MTHSLGPWAAFATLTFDPAGRPGQAAPHTAAAARQRLYDWLRRDEHKTGRAIAAVGGVDRHLSGEPHAHVLLAAEGSLPAADQARLTATWSRLNGWADLQAPRRQARVAGYVARVITSNPDPAGLIIWPEHGTLPTT